MKRHVSTLQAALFSAASLGLSLAPNAAFATPVVEVPNGGTVTINGTYLGSPNPNPAVYQVFATANQCLRIQGIVPAGASAYDIEATLVSPGGTTWQDDDSAGNVQPLIKAIAPGTGWYTLHIAQFFGSTSNGNFTVQIGRFASTDARCQPPTSPRFTSNTPK
jgi:hypothetical protein